MVSPSKAIILPSDTGPSYTRQPAFSVSDDDVLEDDFVWQAMSKAYDPETNTIRDLRIDDSDARAADNYYDFCANLAGKNIKMPFARQLWVAIISLAEYCPRCTNPLWSSCIENVPVDMDPHDLAKKFVLLKRGTCPKCGSKRGAMILSGELNDYYEIVLVFGQRAGKSIFTATLVCYLICCYLKLPKLSTIAKGIQDFTPLTGTFVAITATKAVKLLWDPIRNMIANTEWFQTYFSILEHHGKVYSKEFYQFSPTGTYLRFFHKNLDFYPEGPGKRTLRGPTRACCLAEGTLVSTDRGLIPIESIEPSVHRTHIGDYWTNITAKIPSGTKHCLRITSRYGNTIVASKDHKFLVFDPINVKLHWIKAEDLRVGMHVVRSASCNIEDKALPATFIFSDAPAKDWGKKSLFDWLKSRVGTFLLSDFTEDTGNKGFGRLGKKLRLAGALVRHPKKGCDIPHEWEVASLKKLEKFESDYQKSTLTNRRLNYKIPKELTRDLARLIGYLIADGNYAQWGTTTEISFSTYSEDKFLEYCKLTRKLFGKSTINITPFERGGEVRFSLLPIRKFLAYIGLEAANAPKKKLPACILQAPISLMTECLSTMISCDGAIDTSEAMNPRVRYHTKSPELAQQVLLCFQRLGYAATVKRGVITEEKNRTSYLRGHRTRAAKFQHKKGSQHVYYTVKLCSFDSMHFLDNYYTGLKKRDSSPEIYRHRQIAKILQTSIWPYKIPVHSEGKSSTEESSYSTLSFKNAKRLKLIPEIDRLLVDRGICLDVINSIEEAGAHKTYDISVESEMEAFTAQGFVTHNSAIDELGHFPYKVIDNHSDEDGDLGEDDERERANADEVHTVISRSLATLRTEMPGFYKQGIHHVPQAMLINISSPASWKDKIMRLLKESESNSSMLGLRYPTWEINPLYTRDHPVIRDAYKRNARTADRDFGANPPKLASTIFDKHQVVGLFTGDNSHAIAYEESSEKTLAKVITKIEHNRLPPTILTLDAGASNNSYSGTLQYKEGADVKVISLIEIIPRKGKRIDFYHVYQNVLKPIIQTCNVKMVVYDRWNSYQVIDQIHADFNGKVKALQYTLKARDFTGFQDIVNNEHLSLPKLELEPDRIEAVIDYRKELERYPASHLYLQFLTVQEFGGVWVKGDGYTDDILRALILGVTLLFNPKAVEYLSKFKIEERAGVSPKATVLVAGRSNVFNNFNP